MNKRWLHKARKQTKRGLKALKPFQFYREQVKPTRKGGNVMPLLVSLLRESVLVQGLITGALVVTTCYLWGTGKTVPNELWTANTIVLGFFFGAKTQQKVVQYTQDREK